MSKAIVCDVCGRKQPDVNCRYRVRIRRNILFKRYDFDSQGGTWVKMDVCEDCFKVWVELVRQARNRSDIP